MCLCIVRVIGYTRGPLCVFPRADSGVASFCRGCVCWFSLMDMTNFGLYTAPEHILGRPIFTKG